jgi:hypothetical protein
LALIVQKKPKKIAPGEDNVGSERGHFRRLSAKLGDIGPAPPDVDLRVTTDRPTQ